jgi:hypothetical protein
LDDPDLPPCRKPVSLLFRHYLIVRSLRNR